MSPLSGRGIWGVAIKSHDRRWFHIDFWSSVVKSLVNRYLINKIVNQPAAS